MSVGIKVMNVVHINKCNAVTVKKILVFAKMQSFHTGSPLQYVLALVR